MTEPNIPVIAEAGTAGTLARGLDILEWVGTSDDTSMQRLCSDLGLSRSAAYRIVGLLRDRGYLAGETNLTLGHTIMRLGLHALEGLDLFDIGPDHLRDLVQKTRETAFIAVFDDDQMAYVMQEEGPQVVKVLSKLGSRAPMHASGLGKAYLSALPFSEADGIIARIPLPGYTPTTITTVEQLHAERLLIQETGWAIDDSEREPGVRCVAAPIRGARGAPVAAISVAGPRDRIVAAERLITAAVRSTAARLSEALGAPPSHHPD